MTCDELREGFETPAHATPSQIVTVLKKVNKEFRRVGIYLDCKQVCFRMSQAKKKKKGQAED